MKSGKLYNRSARECAQYIMDSDCEHDSYCDWVEEGHDPREHILYASAVVLDCERELEDIKEYNEQEKSKMV
jgi:hypothetical protein